MDSEHHAFIPGPFVKFMEDSTKTSKVLSEEELTFRILYVQKDDFEKALRPSFQRYLGGLVGCDKELKVTKDDYQELKGFLDSKTLSFLEVSSSRHPILAPLFMYLAKHEVLETPYVTTHSLTIPQTPPVDHLFRNLDSCYKLFALMKENLKSEEMKSAFFGLLEDAIGMNCSRILEIVTMMKAYGNTDLRDLRYLLNVFLFCVHENFQLRPPFIFEQLYLNLYLHCIRHNTIYDAEDSDDIVIQNTFEGKKAQTITLPKLLFLKICMALANICCAYITGESTIVLPEVICNALKISFDDKEVKVKK